eukprot:gene7562-9297_t
MSDDILYEARNFFYLGNYQAAINEINKKSRLIKDKGVVSDSDYYLYRSYIAQGNYDLVLSEIKATVDSPILQGLKLYASYLSNPDSNSEITQLTIQSWISDGLVQYNYHLQIIIASIFCHQQNYEEALRILDKSDFIEGLSLLVQIYLKIDRIDLAEKAYSAMKSIDIDATPSMLSSAWVLVAQGEDSTLKKAYSTFEELSEKYGSTPLLLNSLAICAISMKRFEMAETFLLDAVEKNPKDPDTLINLINCFINLKKPTEIINRYLNQLKTLSPKHQWVEEVNNAEESFER